MKKKQNNLKDVKLEDLNKKLKELEEKIRLIKFKAEGAKSKNVKEGQMLRREVARVLTEINARKDNK